MNRQPDLFEDRVSPPHRHGEERKSYTVPPGHPYYVAPGDWARPGLVDEAFVARSVAVMRDQPDAKKRLRRRMAECMEGIGAIGRVYEGNPNEWAVATRERLFLEYFTAWRILEELQGAPRKLNTF